MAFYSLYHIVKKLREDGFLIEVSTPVDTILETAEIADRFAKHDNLSKPLLFLNNGSQFPMLMNLFANEKSTNDFLKLTEDLNAISRLNSLMSFMDSKPGINQKVLKSVYNLRNTKPRKRCRKGRCMRFTQNEPNLNLLPITKSWPYDGGRFLTLPLVHTIDPDTGKHNVGMYRMQVFDEKTTGMHWHKQKGGAAHFEAWKKKGKKMPVTVTLGGDPILIYCATAPLPEGISEYMLAGFMKNERVKLVKSANSNIWIPECSDFVIEGYIDTEEPLRTEGPFGDHTGFYSLPDAYPVFHITRISHRKNAIYPATLVGIPPKEDQYLGHATSKIFFPLIQKLFAPEIIDMYLPAEGGFHNLALIKIKKNYPGQAEKVMHALWGAGQMMFTKCIMVFSEEVDIRNKNSVIEAIDNYFRPVVDLHLSSGPYDVLDHAAQTFCHGGKAGFDCTRKDKKEIPEIDNNLTADNDSYRVIGQSIRIIFSNHATAESGNLFLKMSANDNILKKGIYIITDLRVKNISDSNLLWYILSNIDPGRDFSLIRSTSAEGVLIINACVFGKRAVPSGGQWPSATVMTDEIIDLVDKKWNSYNIGDFIESPSRQFEAFKSNSYLNK